MADVEQVQIDTSKLNAISPEVIENQATINIGTIGHVAHGKSTLVKAISGVQTVRFKSELERNITIKLGYANAKIYKCGNSKCPRPACYRSYPSSKENHPACEVAGCNGTMKLVRHVSFVDCPGHDILMATMLSGAAVMDAAFLLVAGNEVCPQPQTKEHLAALEIMQLKHIIVLQNKVDLIREEQAIINHREIVDFVKGTAAGNAPIVPISAQLKYNIDAVNEYIVKHIPVPRRSFETDARLIVIRSFDVNKPGTDFTELKGGVAGGSILQGVLKLGQEIEVRPGIAVKDESKEGKPIKCVRPLRSKIISLLAEQNKLQFAVPGGLIGVGTMIDPSQCKGDSLIGNVLGPPGTLPPVYLQIRIKYFLMRRLVGVIAEAGKKEGKVGKLTKDEILQFNIGSVPVFGRVLATKENVATIALLGKPVCSNIGEKVAISRRIDKHFRLIGWGQIEEGQEVDVDLS